jgi:hypothetical protein
MKGYFFDGSKVSLKRPGPGLVCALLPSGRLKREWLIKDASRLAQPTLARRMNSPILAIVLFD